MRPKTDFGPFATHLKQADQTERDQGIANVRNTVPRDSKVSAPLGPAQAPPLEASRNVVQLAHIDCFFRHCKFTILNLISLHCICQLGVIYKDGIFSVHFLDNLVCILFRQERQNKCFLLVLLNFLYY